MALIKPWVPFADMPEENPFYFDSARRMMSQAIQLAWMTTPEWASAPPKAQNFELMERRIRAMVDELLQEAKDAFAKEQSKQ